MSASGDPYLALSVEGLPELRAGLQQAQRDLGREQRKANRVVATKVAGWAQGDARSSGRRSARFAGAIRPASTQRVARLRLASTGRNAGANPTFWGAQGRSGWYAQQKYGGSIGRQHPQWVGNSWAVGKRGQGPYVLNDTIVDHQGDIEDLYLDGYTQAVSAAFPDRRL